MKVLNLFSLLIFVATAFPTFSQSNFQLKSPDRKIVFTFRLTEEAPSYEVSYNGSSLVNESSLSLDFQTGGTFSKNLKMSKPIIKKVNDTYDLIVGKAKTVSCKYNEVTLSLKESQGKQRKINLVVRAFNDGVAFSYEFPEQEGWKDYVLTDENSTFNIAGEPEMYGLYWDYYNNNHEGLYQKKTMSDIPIGKLIDMPALFEYKNGTYMAITDAALRDYAGMYLSKREDGVLTSKLSPLQGQMEIKVKAALPHRTPWRVMMIGDQIGTLIASNILTSLNEPSPIKDWSWLTPGKTSFHWWNGDILPDTTFAPGVNFETNKYYIDFCARNNIEYHAVIGYGGFAWYPNNWPSYGAPGTYSDLTKTVTSLDMQQICDYAASKGVGIHVWVHWKALYPQLEEAFTQFEKWGIKGMMVDFLDRDDQEMVNIQEEILKSAAQHKLYIQFHGAYKPTGLHRTYPNELTREGTHNYEQNKWLPAALTADHDLDIVFTRMLAGAADYHLGGFRAVPAADFKTQYTRPLMGGTRCHMLAMYVVLESYLNMVADYPSAYEGEPGFDFLQDVPTVWDETVVPDAKVGDYVTVARRSGATWYVGSLNDSNERTVSVPLDFLEKGKKYQAKIYADAKDVIQFPNHLTETNQTVSRGDNLSIWLAASGGMVIKITEIDK